MSEIESKHIALRLPTEVTGYISTIIKHKHPRWSITQYIKAAILSTIEEDLKAIEDEGE